MMNFETFAKRTEDKRNEIKQSDISKEDREKIMQARNIIEAVNQNANSERLLEVIGELNSWLIYTQE